MLRRILGLTAVVFLSVLTSKGAIATAQRTFVASNGNDVNACSLVLPCRSFASAIAQTISGGEVIVLDSAGYGPVTITKSVSIIAPSGVYAGISVPALGTGVATSGPSLNIVLRGLTINSIGIGGSGYGVRMTVGGSLAIEDCEITNFIGGWGVKVEAPATVKIDRTTLRSNGNGVVVGYGTVAHIANSRVNESINYGVEVVGGPAGTTTRIYLSDAQLTGSGGNTNCIANSPSASAIGIVAATRVTVTGCKIAFYNAPAGSGPGLMAVGSSMVVSNETGFLNGTGGFNSLGDNLLTDNVTDTSGVIVTIFGH